MVTTIIQAQILIKKLKKTSINKKVQMADTVVNYVIIQFEGNIDTGDSQGLKIYLQATKKIDK